MSGTILVLYLKGKGGGGGMNPFFEAISSLEFVKDSLKDGVFFSFEPLDKALKAS